MVRRLERRTILGSKVIGSLVILTIGYRRTFLPPAAIGICVRSLRRRTRQRQQQPTFYEPQTCGKGGDGGRCVVAVVVGGGGGTAPATSGAGAAVSGRRERGSEQGVDSGQLCERARRRGRLQRYGEMPPAVALIGGGSGVVSAAVGRHLPGLG